MLYDHGLNQREHTVAAPEDPVKQACEKPGIQVTFGASGYNHNDHQHEPPFTVPDI